MLATDPIEERLRHVGQEGRWTGDPPERLGGITDDSRRAEAGDLFCAIRGHATDGHRFLEEAARAGAAGALVEEPVSGAAIPQLVVSDTRVATAHLASLFFGDPAEALRVVGITGTDGKTTTAWILRHLLSLRGAAAALGTLGVVGPAGEREAGDLTTPGPVELHRVLAELRDAGVRHVAMEASSHALDQHRIDGVDFRGMVYTNLSREHLDYHRDMAAYRKAKLRAAELVRPGGFCAVNADEPAWKGLEPNGVETVAYGLSGSTPVRAEEVVPTGSGSRWRLVAPSGEAEVQLPLVGLFNVYNALAAATAALREGLDPQDAAVSLGRTPQVPGRMEILARSPALVVRDYAHTPEALERALGTLRPERGRITVVFGCGGDRDRGKRPLMGRAAAGGSDLAVVTTDNPRSEDPADIAREVVEELDPDDYELVPDRREAIARALEGARAGDVVLLAGKGHEGYQDFGDRREPFDEPRVVEEVLGEAPGGDEDVS